MKTIINSCEEIGNECSEVARLREQLQNTIAEREHEKRRADGYGNEAVSLRSQLKTAVEALREIEKPALGGKQQQWKAKEALQKMGEEVKL